ncbi:MAG: sigma-54 interaction domain-containing protein [Betaproteobacteria bacterium]
MSEQSAIAVWLDPVARLGETEVARLAEAGLRALPARSVAEIESLAGSAERIVLRIIDDPAVIADVQKRVAHLNPKPAVIARIDRDSLELAVGAMRAGADHVIAADDFSTATWRGSRRVIAPAPQAPGKAFVFVDPRSQNLLALAQRVARAEIGVLISGPTGAGKEVLARVLHEASPRSRGPFVALNCAALPETLIESMLFGHEKGAFTGATQSRPGLFEQASGGTLVLDEIGEMPVGLQTRLLRVLQEREVLRLGATTPVKLDFRLVAATNRDLKQAIATREFREDLYFRISAFRLSIPLLRERPGDILPLAAQFLLRHASGAPAPALTSEAGAALLAYHWPGNVRELENVMHRALVLCQSERIEPEHLVFDEISPDSVAFCGSPDIGGVAPEPATAFGSQSTAKPAEQEGSDAGGEGLQSAVRASEYQAIMAAIRTSANRNEAAARLGISPRTLRYKLARLREPAPGSMATIGEEAL